MRPEIRRLMCTVPLLVLAAATGASAQVKSPWVDPPQTLAAPQPAVATPKQGPASVPPPQLPSPEPETTASNPAPAAEAAPRRTASPSRNTDRAGETIAQRRPAAASTRLSSTRPARGRREISVGTAVAKADRAGPSRAALARRASDSAARRLALSERSLRPGHAGFPGGLEVMNLQTLEGPDGRRITVLTRPTPRTIEDFLAGRVPLD